MNSLAILFFLIDSTLLLSFPRRWTPLPLLAGACYMTLGQGVQIGPFHFQVMRLLLLVGFIRVLARRERLARGLNTLDWIMLAWGAWALFSSVFVQSFVGQLGTVYNTLGIYFLIRILCQNVEDLVHLAKIMAFVLAPVALEMINEQISGRNLFASFGGVPELVVVRNDHLRAQGPFSHAILAGTVGAACLPFMIGIWRRHPLAAKVGTSACLVMAITCRSSGPLMSVVFSAFALVMWRWRHLTHTLRIAAVAGYILLDIVMKAPAYYLIARIDLTGSSTGWHRAELIAQAIAHFNEWWFAGTLYTRHWMPYGVSWSEDHCDITNQYIGYGVFGGLALMLLFIAALWVAFRYVGQFLRANVNGDAEQLRFVWALGSALFAQAASCVSVYYFDQSFVFLFLNLAAIGSLYTSKWRQNRALGARPMVGAPLQA
ncbi:MAG: hypothetical protein K8T26_10150 [Lentisphaerae bacterium]|nr:hypothetical protein [Lentisphaerota bacterium]